MGSTPQQAHDGVGEGVERDHQGAARHEHHQRRGEQERGAVGPASAMFFGTISPRPAVQVGDDRQRDHERDGCTRRRARPARRTGSRRCAIAGSATAPSPSEQTVMPSWAPAIISETCSIAPACAPPRARLARGSIWVRRAEIRANSAPTKNALASRSAPISSSDRGQLIGSPPHAGAGRRGGPGRCAPAARGAAATSHRGLPSSSSGPASCTRPVARARGCGRARATTSPATSYGPPARGSESRQLVRPTPPVRSAHRGDRPRPVAAAPEVGARAVVLVATSPTSLLDHVLERHDARRAAVLVDDDGHLEAVLAQQRQQRVEPQRVGTTQGSPSAARDRA